MFMVESTWLITGCEMLATRMPAMKPPTTSTNSHFSIQFMALLAKLAFVESA